jgi:hypothetical protein
MTSKSESLRLRKLIGEPNRFVARLILAELIAKRGKGPLHRRSLRYRSIRR